MSMDILSDGAFPKLSIYKTQSRKAVQYFLQTIAQSFEIQYPNSSIAHISLVCANRGWSEIPLNGVETPSIRQLRRPLVRQNYLSHNSQNPPGVVQKIPVCRMT